jgi:hypothetical protein
VRVKDMVAAIGFLLVLVLVVGGLSHGFGFTPTGPTVDQSAIPVVDAPSELRGLASSVPYPLRVPVTPAGWRSTSVAEDPVAGTDRTDVRVGYLTTQSRYLQLLQTDAPEDALLAAQTGARTLPAQGPQTVAGGQWVVYGAEPQEPVWIADLPTPGGGPVRVLISGSATADDYRTLAAAVQAGEILK